MKNLRLSLSTDLIWLEVNETYVEKWNGLDNIEYINKKNAYLL